MNKIFRTLINAIPSPLTYPLKTVYNHLFPVYLPYYNRNTPLSNSVPEIYNKYGEKMNIFFINDVNFAHEPYGDSRYFLWDRYNFALDTHFYTHDKMLHTVGKPLRRFGWLLESEAIVPADYTIFDKNPGLHTDFEFIFTYSEKLLADLPNARFAPAGNVWYGKPKGGGIMQQNQIQSKEKNLSIVASNNSLTSCHRLRQKCARRIKQQKLGDTFGNFDGGSRFEYIADTLAKYRYSIVIENDLKPYYFTEKILNCFAAMTIPVYLGATKIGNFFNQDGIIMINPQDIDTIEAVIKKCTKETYYERKSAIEDNYQRVQNFLSIEDYIYKSYL